VSRYLDTRVKGEFIIAVKAVKSGVSLHILSRALKLGLSNREPCRGDGVCGRWYRLDSRTILTLHEESRVADPVKISCGEGMLRGRGQMRGERRHA
jgi:hypothetical protein